MKSIVERLKNGLTVVSAPSSAAPVIAFQMWVGVGSADEFSGEEGLAHVFEHMLFKGTDTRPVGEIARDVERAGGHINAWTSHDETVFFITLASGYWRKGLEILADAIQHPSLDEGELGRELAVILEEIRMGEDAPERVVTKDLFASVFRRHPYGRPVIGFEKTVKRFTRKMVQNFYRRWYVPSNMVLAVAGDFDQAAMLREISRAFGKFVPGPVPPRGRRFPEPTQKNARYSHAVRPINEAHVAVGFKIPGLDHEDVPALDLLAAIIGQGASSRLETIARRKYAVVNSVRSMAYTPSDAGVFGIFSVMPGYNMERAIKVIFDELIRMISEPISTAEINKGRTLIESDRVYMEETVDGVARKLGFYALHAKDVGFEERYLAAIAGIGPEDLTRVAGRYLSIEAANVTATLPDPSRYAFKRRVPWVSGRGSSRRINGEKLRKAVKAQVDSSYARRARRVSGAHREDGTAVFDLPAGDVLLVKRDPTSRLVAARAAFFGGLRSERPSQAGIAALTANSLTRGTKDLSAEHIALRMDALACSVGGFAGRNTLGVYGEFLSSNFDDGFSLMADCLRRPSFPDEEVQREKALLIEEIRAGRDNPGQLVFSLFHKTMFGSHPYGRPVLGFEETVEKLFAKQLKRHLEQNTSSGKMVLAVVGGIDVEKARELTKRHIVSQRFRGPKSRDPRPWHQPKTARKTVFSLPKEQSHILVGFGGTRITSEDRFQVEVLVEILGGHGGRLFEGVREKKGLAYSVTALSMEGIEPGYIAMYAATSPGKEAAVVEAMLEETGRLRKAPPTKDELKRIKRFLVGSRAIAWQRASSRAASMALDHLYGNGHDAADHYPGRIEAVTRDDVIDAALAYLSPSRSVIACVGPNMDDLRINAK
jgi:zinc protease